MFHKKEEILKQISRNFYSYPAENLQNELLGTCLLTIIRKIILKKLKMIKI